MLRVGFIGAGPRARSAHYPNVHRLENISVEAVAELDEERLNAIADEYAIPRRFTDHREMLDKVDLDLVYCVMNEIYVLEPALDCLNAGKHVFIEKPPGKNSEETQQLLEAAVANDRFLMVGFQRRYAAVTREAMRLVAERGPATLAVGRFHKWLPNGPGNTSTLWNDVCHIVDLVRYMVGSEVVEVTAYQDAHGTDWRNCYSGMIRFANDAVGIVLGNRASGGRILRAELHGIGVGCYMDIPSRIEILEAKEKPRLVSGAELVGGDPSDEPRYEGVLTMHEHFIECIEAGRVPISDIRDVIHTAHLLDRLEGIAP